MPHPFAQTFLKVFVEPLLRDRLDAFLADGLAVAARQKPDVILMDYTMPMMDGFETMEQLISDQALKTIPVVMLTAESAHNTLANMVSLGVRDYLIKPFKEDVHSLSASVV